MTVTELDHTEPWAIDFTQWTYSSTFPINVNPLGASAAAYSYVLEVMCNGSYVVGLEGDTTTAPIYLFQGAGIFRWRGNVTNTDNIWLNIWVPTAAYAGIPIATQCWYRFHETAQSIGEQDDFTEPVVTEELSTFHSLEEIVARQLELRMRAMEIDKEKIDAVLDDKSWREAMDALDSDSDEEPWEKDNYQEDESGFLTGEREAEERRKEREAELEEIATALKEYRSKPKAIESDEEEGSQEPGGVHPEAKRPPPTPKKPPVSSS